MTLLIKNVKACISDELVKKDILIEDGKIVAIEDYIQADPGKEVINADSLYAVPGMIDIHTHLDDKIGEYDLADSYYTGSKIALMNGITSLFTFVTESQSCSLNNAIMMARNKADGNCLCDYHWHLTPTSFSRDDLFNITRLIEQGFTSYKLYTTYRQAGVFSDYNRIEQFAQFIKLSGGKLLIHCEDDMVLFQNQNAYRYLNNAKSHSQVRPDYAEIKAIDSLLNICQKTQIPMHFVHISSYKSVEILMKVKDKLPITFETAPHYLFLNDEMLNLTNGYQLICSPPLRSEDNVKRMRYYALEGDFDCYATDHCAFYKRDKDLNKIDFRKVPNGIPGIGALVPLIYNLYEESGEKAFIQMSKHLSENPARLTDIYPQKGTIAVGSDADLAILGIDNERSIEPSLQDVYNPYEYLSSKLNVYYTIKDGEIVVKNGELIKELPGKELNREAFRNEVI